MAEVNILFELGLIAVLAAGLALIGKKVKQPTIIAYLLTGIIAGPLFLNIIKSTELIEIFSHLGVTFLLFIVGLSLDFRVFKQIGKVATVTGVGQIILTSMVGFIIALYFGFSFTPAIYLAAALAFSSTVIVINVLSEKRELDTLHGRIALGILLVQDFVAAAFLILIPILGSADLSLIIEQVIKGVLLIFGVFIISSIVIPQILKSAAKNQETLFLFSLGWAFIVAIAFYELGLSIEAGALIAGMSLASSKFSTEISGKIKSLREFFVIIHLIFFGTLLVGPITDEMLVQTGVFSALIVLGNPLIIMSAMKLFGYKKKLNFKTGISIAQISEFSLILVFLGFSQGAVSQQVLSLTILIAITTIAISVYGMFYSNKIYKLMSPMLGIFDGKGNAGERVLSRKKYDIILFGYNRIGFSLLKAFKKSGEKYVIVDYNPETIENLSAEGVPCIYGDSTDIELLNDLRLGDARMIISTIPDLESNLMILSEIKNDKVIFIPTSHSITDTKKLYEAGADYVIMPHFLGGDYVAEKIVHNRLDKNWLRKERKKQMSDLEERERQGHTHPNKEGHGF